MTPRKKNKFFTFIFSFVPGLAEMYMGFMKSGISLFVGFILPFIIAGILYDGDYIVMASLVVYFLAFFHARHLATAPEEQFCIVEDRFIWEEIIDIKKSDELTRSYKKWTAIALIFFGTCGVWSLFREYIFKLVTNLSEQNMEILHSLVDGVPRFAFSILVIVIGILLIKGKKKELEESKDGAGEN